MRFDGTSILLSVKGRRGGREKKQKEKEKKNGWFVCFLVVWFFYSRTKECIQGANPRKNGWTYASFAVILSVGVRQRLNKCKYKSKDRREESGKERFLPFCEQIKDGIRDVWVEGRIELDAKIPPVLAVVNSDWEVAKRHPCGLK